MALREVLAIFNVQVDQSQLVSAEKRIDAVIGTLKTGAKVLKAFGAALGVQALAGFITSTVQAADDVGDLAARLGLANDEFQILKAVADDVGSSVGAIQTGFRILAGAMKDGSGEFAKLGVATKNSDGSLRDVQDVFWDTGTAIAALGDQASQWQTSQKLLGRGGKELIPIFAGGADAVAKYRAEIAKTAVIFDEEFIKSADATAKQLGHLHRRFERIKVLVVSQLLPAFNILTSWLEKGAEAIQEYVKSGQALPMLIAAAAGAFALLAPAIWAAMAPLLPVIAAIGLVALAVDEVIATFRGGDTFIRRAIDGMFGVGATKAVFDGITTTVLSLIDTFKVLLSVGSMTAEEFEMAFIKASAGIGEAFDGMFASLGRALSDFGEFFVLLGQQIWDSITGAVGAAVEWVGAKLREIPGVSTAMEIVSSAGSALGNLAPGAGLAPTLGAFSAPAMLSPGATAAAAAGSFEDNRQQKVEVHVQGNATPAVAREIAAKTGAALAQQGRDMAAIGAAVGLRQ